MKTGGERLDIYLVRLGYAPSRRAARNLIERGLVRVNRRPGRKGELVVAGDEVEVAQHTEAARIVPNPDIHLEVLFQDAAVIVVNKPAPMPCHPLRAGESGTLMNGVAAAFPETAACGNDPREGGLVHRLDNGTSGALLIARTSPAFGALRDAIRNGLVIRRYKALVSGHLDRALRLNAPIAHHPHNRRRMIVVEDEQSAAERRARPALTIVEPIGRVAQFTLVSVLPKTGNRHQIRVHLASAGYPLVGDTLYAGPTIEALAPDRFWLHLRALEFDSPASGRIKVSAPYPADLAHTI